MKIKYATAIYTGGGIYSYHGQLEEGTFFGACDDWQCIEICNSDTSVEAAGYSEFYDEHRINTLVNNQYETFWNEMLLWIIRNKPKGNYTVEELESRIKNKNKIMIDENGGHDMENLLRERVKLYLITEDNWFIKTEDNMENVEKVCQIEDASSYYAEYDAVKLFEKCEQLGIACKIIKYTVIYKPEQEIKIAK